MRNSKYWDDFNERAIETVHCIVRKGIHPRMDKRGGLRMFPLVRDGIFNAPGKRHEKCKYGCNRRLVAFNEIVEKELKK